MIFSSMASCVLPVCLKERKKGSETLIFFGFANVGGCVGLTPACSYKRRGSKGAKNENIPAQGKGAG